MTATTEPTDVATEVSDEESIDALDGAPTTQGGAVEILRRGIATSPELTVGLRATVMMGLGVAGLFLLILPAGLVVGLRRPWESIAVRVAGSWIAAIGLMAAAV